MPEPIYALWQAKRTAAWYQLSPQEVEKLLAKDDQALKSVGGRNIISCDSRWSSGRWEWFGIDEFPDLEARQAFVAAHEEMKIYQYYEVEFILATGDSVENIVPKVDEGQIQ